MLLNSFSLFLKKNFYQIKKGGFEVILKKLLSSIVFIFQIPIYVLSIPTVIVLRILSGIYLIRLCELNSSRIGHFAKETELIYLENKELINTPNQKYLNLFFFNKYISNHQLAKMWKRKLNILPRWLIFPLKKTNDFVNIFISDNEKHQIVKSNMTMTKDKNNLLEKTSSSISFNDDEEKKGQKLLLQLGITKKDKFVCLGIRDSAYLASRSKDRDYSYHDYRDGKLEAFILASEELTRRGYFVIRMGANVLEKLNTDNPKILDYANMDIRSDFLDIYLASKCRFCISTDYGLDEVMVIFRKPILYIGVAPIGTMETHNKNTLILFKEHIDIKNKKMLSISQIFERNLSAAFKSDLYKKNNVQLIHNTNEDIKNAAIEMDERLNNKWKDTNEETLLQKDFWKIFETNIKKKDFVNYEIKEGKQHGILKSRIGSSFLKKINENIK